jgi:hypothetical protein
MEYSIKMHTPEFMYSIRNNEREEISDAVRNVISGLKISTRPPPMRKFVKPRAIDSNWREFNLLSVVRKVREKDDPDYDAVMGCINKLTRTSMPKMVEIVLGHLTRRDHMFRLRVTTLLFDSGIKQAFFAPLMATMYTEIIKVFPDAQEDLMTQITMFNELYDVNSIVNVPESTDSKYDEAIISWTTQKNRKRGFAEFVSELFKQKLIPQETMDKFLKTIMDELKVEIYNKSTSITEEHVDSLVRFLFAVVKTCPAVKEDISNILKTKREETPSLNMKSRFKLEDALKI